MNNGDPPSADVAGRSSAIRLAAANASSLDWPTTKSSRRRRPVFRRGPRRPVGRGDNPLAEPLAATVSLQPPPAPSGDSRPLPRNRFGATRTSTRAPSPSASRRASTTRRCSSRHTPTRSSRSSTATAATMHSPRSSTFCCIARSSSPSSGKTICFAQYGSPIF